MAYGTANFTYGPSQYSMYGDTGAAGRTDEQRANWLQASGLTPQSFNPTDAQQRQGIDEYNASRAARGATVFQGYDGRPTNTLPNGGAQGGMPGGPNMGGGGGLIGGRNTFAPPQMNYLQQLLGQFGGGNPYMRQNPFSQMGGMGLNPYMQLMQQLAGRYGFRS